MNVKQKISLGIIAPMFAFAIGHTAINKINQQKQTEQEYLDFCNNVDVAISKMSMAKDAEFKAKLNMDSTDVTSEQAKELIELIQKNENK